MPSLACVFCSYRCRKQYKSIIQARVELAKAEHRVKEQQTAEKRLEEETKKKQREKEEELKILEQEQMRKEEEQRMKVIEEQKGRQEENKRAEEHQKAPSSELLADDSELRQQVLGSDCALRQNSQCKAGSTGGKQRQQGKVKFDEENRLHEQLKMLQEQAVRQTENELNQLVSKGTSVTADDSLAGSEKSKKKHKQTLRVTKESEKQLCEQKRFEEESNEHKQLVQEEHKAGESEKQENVPVHQNNRKPESQKKQVKHVKKKEAEKIEELGKRKDEEKVERVQIDNECLPQDNVTSSKKKNLTQNDDGAVKKRDSTIQISPKATATCAGHVVMADFMHNNAKHEHSQSALQKEVGCHISSDVASQTQKPIAATKFQAKKSTCRETSNVWEKTVEAKRLYWMHNCETWRYTEISYLLCDICLIQ